MGLGETRGCGKRLIRALLSLSILVNLAASALADKGVDPDVRSSDRHAAALIRSTLITLNDANLAANYSVLRDLAAPDFQAKFSIDRLVATFKVLRDKQIDLAATVLLEPVIVRFLFVKAQNIMQLQGYVPTEPVQVGFRFSYQKVDGRWKLYTLDLDFEAASSRRRAVGSAL